MAKFGDGGDLLKCSFCGKSQKQVKKLIAGPGVYICDECIDLCNEIIEEELSQTSEVRFDELPKPREIYEYLNDYVIGQEQAEEDPVGRGLQPLQARAGRRLRRRRRRARRSRTSCSSARPGCGKTLLAQTLARLLKVPFAIADATALTEAGLRRRGRREHPPQADPGRRLRRQEGRDRDHLHRRDRQDRPQGREPVDHPRRLRRRCAAGAAQDPRGHHRVGAAAGRSQAPAPGVHPDRHHEHPVHLRWCVRRPRQDHREPHRQHGASASVPTCAAPARRTSATILGGVLPEDLLKFGLIPEFVGRLPVIGAVHNLDQDALMRILIEPKNALLQAVPEVLPVRRRRPRASPTTRSTRSPTRR